MLLQPFLVLKVVTPHLIAHNNPSQKRISLCLAALQMLQQECHTLLLVTKKPGPVTV
jgi:hypothetical protein